VQKLAQGNHKGSEGEVVPGDRDPDPSLCALQDIWFIKSLLEEHRRLPRAAKALKEMITRGNVDRFSGW
jgi:hypothetical protein